MRILILALLAFSFILSTPQTSLAALDPSSSKTIIKGRAKSFDPFLEQAGFNTHHFMTEHHRDIIAPEFAGQWVGQFYVKNPANIQGIIKTLVVTRDNEVFLMNSKGERQDCFWTVGASSGALIVSLDGALIVRIFFGDSPDKPITVHTEEIEFFSQPKIFIETWSPLTFKEESKPTCIIKGKTSTILDGANYSTVKLNELYTTIIYEISGVEGKTPISAEIVCNGKPIYRETVEQLNPGRNTEVVPFKDSVGKDCSMVLKLAGAPVLKSDFEPPLSGLQDLNAFLFFYKKMNAEQQLSYVHFPFEDNVLMQGDLEARLQRTLVHDPKQLTSRLGGFSVFPTDKILGSDFVVSVDPDSVTDTATEKRVFLTPKGSNEIFEYYVFRWIGNKWCLVSKTLNDSGI